MSAVTESTRHFPSTDREWGTMMHILDEYTRHISHHSSFQPRFDLEQHENSYELFGELPGARQEDIVIETLDDRHLQISGKIDRVAGEADTVSGEASQSADATSGFIKVRHGDVPRISHHFEAPDVLQKHLLEEALHPTKPSESSTKSKKSLESTGAPVPEQPGEATAKASEAQAVQPKPASVGGPKVKRLISERHVGNFVRSFHFPTPIKTDDIVARMHNGIMHVTIPMGAKKPTKKIHIDWAPSGYGPFPM